MPRFFLAGSASDFFFRKEAVQKVLQFGNFGKKTPKLAYIGAATYDINKFFEKQAGEFRNQGCELVKIDLVQLPTCLKNETEDKSIPFSLRAQNSNKEQIKKLHAEIFENYKSEILSADIILVSGGNTVFLMDRMKKSGIDEVLKQKAKLDDGAIFCGGSAGFIIYFDSGHSDSMETLTTLNAMVGAEESEDQRKQVDEFMQKHFPKALGANIQEHQKDSWDYVRVEGLGLMPGFAVPHADTIAANDKVSVRCAAWENMALRINKNSGGTERGICVDHYCALVIDGDNFEEWYLPGDFPGSSIDGGSERVLLEDSEKRKVWNCADFGDEKDLVYCNYSAERKGRPGVWVREYRREWKSL